MLSSFFNTLREMGVPCSLREFLDLHAALGAQVVFASADDFYYLSRSVMVKDETHFDKFDRAFDLYFKGLDSFDDIVAAIIPDEWLRREFEKSLTEEEKAQIESLGGLEKLVEEFKKRLQEQEKRHEGGNRWIGTGGTSPFGHSGYNPMGIRVGGEGGQKKAVKVWEQRQYRNLDSSVELGTRNIKLALRRLRRFANVGRNEELDLDDTIRATARNAGWLDLRMRAERENSIKVLVFFDVGGSMDAYVRICEELFSACRTEFRHLEYFYFHNFLYESVWRDNSRRNRERVSLTDIMHTYAADYRVILVGDATMAPYEITNPGGSIEHWNEEAGAAWMNRLTHTYTKLVWLNPTPPDQWDFANSIGLAQQLIQGRMFPLTLEGLDASMTYLTR